MAWDVVGWLVFVGVGIVLTARHVVRPHTVLAYERALLFRKGRLERVLEPGLYWLFVPWSKLERVDMRTRAISVPGQEVLSADNVSLKVSLAARVEIVDPEKAVVQVESWEQTLYQILQLRLRELVGGVPIAELMEKRAELNRALAEVTGPALAAIGLKLHEVGVRDVMFPGRLKEVFAQVVEAEKAGQAALVRARSEVAANRALLNAARLVRDHPELVTMKTLQALAEASRTAGTTLSLSLPAASAAPAPPAPTPPTASEPAGDA